MFVVWCLEFGTGMYVAIGIEIRQIAPAGNRNRDHTRGSMKLKMSICNLSANKPFFMVSVRKQKFRNHNKLALHEKEVLASNIEC
jgi:hypothetical protein